MSNTTLAITITYHPQLSQLQKQLERLQDSHVDIIVVDNGSANQSELATLLIQNFPDVKFLANSANQGIAFAQNLGIKFAAEHHYPYVLLMDQDSLPGESMVKELQKAIELYPDAAAVGPQFVDTQQEIRSRFIQVNNLRVIKNPEPDRNGCIRVDHLISSGSLIRTEVFERVGLMDEELFIDYVDIEWALRARSRNLESYGVTTAVMHHTLGEGRVKFLKNSVACHSPLRHYYQIRNAVLIYQRDYIPWNWKVVDAYKLLAKTFIFILSSRQKKLELKMIAKGIIHGIRNVKGKLELSTYE